MSGYTVQYSIDVIDEICNDPERYKNSIQGAINDAKVHYEFEPIGANWSQLEPIGDVHFWHL